MNSNTIDKSTAYEVLNTCQGAELEIQLLQLGLSVPDAGHYAMIAEGTTPEGVVKDMTDSGLITAEVLSNILTEVVEAEAKQQAEAGDKEFLQADLTLASTDVAPRDRAQPVSSAIAAFEQCFMGAIAAPASRESEQDAVARRQTAQEAAGELFGLSGAQIQGAKNNALLSASKNTEADASQSFANEGPSPEYQAVRARLAKAVSNQGIEVGDVPTLLAKSAYGKRLESSALASSRAFAASRSLNEEVKVVFSAFNSAARTVVRMAATAVAKDQFHSNGFREEFKYEDRVYSIDKAAGDLPAAGLWSDEDPLFGLPANQVLASFQAWRDSIDAVYLGLVLTREDHRYSAPVTVVTPGSFDALEFLESNSDKARTFTENVYIDFSVDSQVEEAMVRLKVEFAQEAKASAYLGADVRNKELGLDF